MRATDTLERGAREMARMNEESSWLFATQKYIWIEPNNWTNSLPTEYLFTIEAGKRAKLYFDNIRTHPIQIGCEVPFCSRFGVQTDVIAAIFFYLIKVVCALEIVNEIRGSQAEVFFSEEKTSQL